MLAQQITALIITQRVHGHPNSQHSGEEDNDDDQREENPFANNRERRRPPTHQQHHGRWESGFKLDILEFKGCLQPEEFLDWVVVVEETLEFKDMPQDK